jgi:phospholipase/lecithinase/hemolysin
VGLGGAQNLLVLDLPDFGRIPRLNTTPLAPLATLAAFTFNQDLLAALAGDPVLAGTNLRILDVFGLLDQAVAHPAEFGFTNVTDRCLAPPADPATPYSAPSQSVCATPNSYLSWDDIHPTTHTHAIIAAAALSKVVPEPAGLGLLVVGLVGLFGLHRRSLAA